MSPRIQLAGSDFRGGLDLSARWADILLDETRFGAPSVVTFLEEHIIGGHDADIRELVERRPNERGRESPRPEVVSVRRANVEGLLLSGVSLRRCRFVKAHNLDRLRLENDVRFSHTRRYAFHSQRRIISEEAHWRATHQRGAWVSVYREKCMPPEWLTKRDPRLATSFEARLVATLYRSLRKGREDAKDEPGAADFYYGEMEMRRHDKTAPFAERVILWAYWLVSGYGLRASRAFLALTGTVLAFAFALDTWGLPEERTFQRALLISFQGTTSLLREVNAPLTPEGEVMVTALRLLGPLLFGLMLLSLRGRVKR